MSYYSYHNQGATRNKPASDRLLRDLAFLEEMGVDMRIISGGQDAKGEGTRRTGSTRHDHGNAVDADFYIGDKKITPDSHPAIFNQIVQNAKRAGVVGIGEGDDYMGSGRMHLGYGNAGVWGAGGKGANAPEWLVNAYNGVEAGHSEPGHHQGDGHGHHEEGTQMAGLNSPPAEDYTPQGLLAPIQSKVRKQLGLSDKRANEIGEFMMGLSQYAGSGGFG